MPSEHPHRPISAADAASRTPRTPKNPTPPPSGAVTITVSLMICATIVAVVWLLTGAPGLS